MNSNWNITDFMDQIAKENKIDYCRGEPLFSADILLRSGYVYQAEIEHVIEVINSDCDKVGDTYFTATIEHPDCTEEIELGKFIKCRKVSYNGDIRWMILE